jgi:hypothetical protein
MKKLIAFIPILLLTVFASFAQAAPSSVKDFPTYREVMSDGLQVAYADHDAPLANAIIQAQPVYGEHFYAADDPQAPVLKSSQDFGSGLFITLVWGVIALCILAIIRGVLAGTDIMKRDFPPHVNFDQRKPSGSRRLRFDPHECG